MIVHLDADAFYASVEQATDPRLRGRPVAVGGQKRGVVASASYEARRLGIHTTMPTARAKKICPGLVVVPGDFEKYERFSRFMFSYLYDFTPVVEVASIDEGYFDLRGIRDRKPAEIAATIRSAIGRALRISVSQGIAGNKLVSSIASKLRKPASFIEVGSGGEREFLAPLENSWLPGVGPQLAQALNRAGLVRIGQIACIPPQQLSLIAGSGARQLRDFALGQDDRPVVADPPAAKSWSAQETFEEDVTDEAFVLARLRSLADRLFARLRTDGRTVRTVEVRIRYNDFDDCRRSESLPEPTDLETDAYPAIARLLHRAWQRRVSLRLVGIKLSGVHSGAFQTALPLVDAGADHAVRRSLSPVLDALRGRYGSSSIMRGHDLFLKTYHRPPAPRPPAPATRRASSACEWAALNIKSGYSFLDSLLKPSDAVELAVRHGCRAVALTDPNLHGAVEFFQLARQAGIHPVIAAEITDGGRPVLAYVRNETGYVNLCAILSTAGRGLTPDRREGLILRPADWLPEIRYAGPSERPMFSVLQSIRTLSLFDEDCPGKRTGAFHFPRGDGLARFGSALRDSLEIAGQCDFSFRTGVLCIPRHHPPDGSTARAFLRRLALEGMARRYAGRPALLARVRSQIEEELRIIAEVGYEEYFLLVRDILDDCEERGISWITRGSAADSLVCYCLGISDVCPVRFDLYFRRFLNPDRMALNKLPDIDIDFAHDRRDEVIGLVFKKFGPHAAAIGGFNTFQGRSAFADIAKVMGVSEFQIRRMTEFLPRTTASGVGRVAEESQECRDRDYTEDPYATALRLAERLDGFPRHPKMHPCGIVLSRPPIRHLTPVFTSAGGYPATHFDMEQAEAIGLVKIDILAQGGLAVMRDTCRLLAEQGRPADLRSLEPWQDPEVWKMIGGGHARGVHHIESPAMTTLERMVNVNNIDDLVAIVSVIRPGAANSLKKEQFARRAQGLEKPDYPHPSVEPVLRSTYGVVAYEEHILQICEAFAGLPAGRADVLRRALVKGRKDTIRKIGLEFSAAAEARGHTAEAIRNVWNLVAGFEGYAFCRAHSTAYGVEAYQAAWLKRHHPAEFLSCVLQHGKGFYSRLVYSLECRRLGIGFLHPDVNSPHDTFRPEGNAIRVPVSRIGGLGTGLLERLSRQRPFDSLPDFYERAGPSCAEMTALIRTGALDGFGMPRTAQFWEFRRLAQWQGGRGAGLNLTGGPATLPDIPLEEPSLLGRLRDEMELLGFTVSAHPLEQFPDIAWDTYCPIDRLHECPGGRVTIAGLIVEDRLHRQVDGRPMKFLSICDRSGIIECELFASAYRAFGAETVRHPVVEVRGRVIPFENGNGHTLRVESVRKPRRSPPVAS